MKEQRPAQEGRAFCNMNYTRIKRYQLWEEERNPQTIHINKKIQRIYDNYLKFLMGQIAVNVKKIFEIKRKVKTQIITGNSAKGENRSQLNKAVDMQNKLKIY